MGTFGKCKGGGRRSATRTTAPLLVTVTTLARSQSAVLIDVSCTGARLRGTDLPETGEELFLNVEGVIAFGTVAWMEDDERGVAFESDLTASDEKRLRQAVALARGLPPEMRAALDDWTLGVAR